MTVSGTGYKANTAITITIASTPTKIGQATSSSSGSFSATVTIPSTLASGTHTLSASGAAPGGTTLVLSSDITVSAATLPKTGGWMIGTMVGIAAAMVALGLVLINTVRKRTANS